MHAFLESEKSVQFLNEYRDLAIGIQNLQSYENIHTR